MKQSLKLMCFWVLVFPMAVNAAEDKLQVIFDTMHHCYHEDNQIGTSLARCMLKKLEHDKNPEGYRVQIVDDNPNKQIASNMTLTIYNKAGLVIVCKGIAKEKIQITGCTGQKLQPLTPGQVISIEPPSAR